MTHSQRGAAPSGARRGDAWRRFRSRVARLGTNIDAERHPRRRRVWLWLGVLVVVLAAYPVLVTAALWTGLVEKMLLSEDLKVEIDNPAWTIWPGRIHLAGVRVYTNGETQFILRAEDVRANIQLLPLVKRRFFVSSLYAKNVSYHMRLQVDDSELDSPRVAAFPPLEGLPGDPTKRKARAEQTEERESEWTVQLENIDVHVHDLWFMEYRYEGDGRLRGGFLRGPDVMRVHSSVQDLGPGDLKFGREQLIAKNFRGQLQAEIPEVNPEQHADTGFFQFVKANINLDADVQTLKHLEAYLGKLKVKGGSGPLQIRVAMEDGALSRQSTIAYSTKEVTLLGDGFGVKSDWQVDFEVGADEPNRKHSAKTARGDAPPLKATIRSAKPAGEPVVPWLRSKALVTYVSLARPHRPPFTIQLHDHQHSASLSSAKITEKTKLRSGHLSFPSIVTTDLDDLDTLAGNDSKFETDRGSARARLTLDLDEHGNLQGPFSARLDEASLAVSGVRLGGNGRLASYVYLNPATRSTVLSDISIDLRDMGFRLGNERVDHWWMKLKSDRLRATGMPPKNLSADLSIVAKDAEPVIEALAEKDKIPDIVAKLISLEGLKVRAEVRKRGEVLDVMLDTLESDVIDFSGRVFLNDKQRLIALLIGGKTISLGIYKHGQETDYGVLAGSRWLNDKLEKFPPPEDRVRGQKP